MQTVYFHGFSGDSEGLRDLAGVLPYKNYHLYTLPGFQNRRVSKDERDNLNVYIERVINELTELFPADDIHLIGHSHGAMIAFAVAANPKSRVRRLTLINPVRSPRLLSRITARVATGASLYGPERLITNIFKQKIVVDIASRHMTKHESHDGKAKVRDMRRMESQYYTKDMLLLARHVDQFRRGFNRAYISMPTTIIYGSKDNISGYKDHEWYKDHCRGDIKLLQHRGGHLRVITSPHEVGALLTAKDAA